VFGLKLLFAGFLLIKTPSTSERCELFSDQGGVWPSNSQSGFVALLYKGQSFWPFTVSWLQLSLISVTWPAFT